MKYLLYVIFGGILYAMSVLAGYSLLYLAILFSGYEPMEENCGDGYYFSWDELCYRVKDLKNEKTISYSYSDSLGNVRSFDYNCDRDLVLLGPKVIAAESDDEFVLVTQKSRDLFDSIYTKAIQSDSLSFYGFTSDREKSFKSHFDYNEYWIISKQNRILYGPLSEKVYCEFRKKLGVPDKLRLPFENDNYKLELMWSNFIVVLILLSPFWIVTSLFVWIIVREIRKKGKNFKSIL